MHHFEQRIRKLNDKPVPTEKTCVLYVMGRDQRVQDNHALALAQQQALQFGVPLAVVFCLLPRSGQRAKEHYRFMIDGLRQVEAELSDMGIPFMMVIGNQRQRLMSVFTHLKPQLVVFDFSPLRGPQQVHAALAESVVFPIIEVDTHNIVPVWQASDHQEVGARTLRPKYKRMMPDYLSEATDVTKHPHAWPGPVKPIDELQVQIEAVLDAIPSNGTDISRFESGTKAAVVALQTFIDERLEGYADNRNDPSKFGQSELNPYLHYGQLSSAAAVRAVLEITGNIPRLQADADVFIEEITVRRELSDNFCYYNPHYDSLEGAPQWARTTLHKHTDDERQTVYDLDQLERAETHDAAWNAAQSQLTTTGKMHGYMRMYWAKKVLEWSKTPEDAMKTLLYLNDFYHIDGGDPNGYVGILWSIAGLHDRPWGERPIYGVVRSMVYNGLKRKFDIEAYISRYPQPTAS